ncbi:MAG: 3-deoxy-D-manno-octulosonic acid transferase, partial [Ferruginibacter sp.]|nr:3-deoxy-D-manno-octulosonic acid transferase [Ferruginibacter sp.]
NITVTGDTRFDRVIEIAEQFEPIPLIEKFCGDHKILVAGSTWEDDEAELIHYARANPRLKFIIAPHEIDKENLKDVKKEFGNAIFYSELLMASGQEEAGGMERGNQQRTTTNEHPTTNNDQRPTTNEQPTTTNEPPIAPNVLIIDNVGMLSRLYHYAYITYVGGGFGADGVHNVLEAAVYGKPVIYGPVFEKYPEAIGLLDCGGGITIQNALELESILKELWEDENLLTHRGEAAKNYVYSNAGASNKIVRFIQEKRLLTN